MMYFLENLLQKRRLEDGFVDLLSELRIDPGDVSELLTEMLEQEMEIQKFQRGFVSRLDYHEKKNVLLQMEYLILLLRQRSANN